MRPDDLDPRRTQAPHGLVDIVDDESDVALLVGDMRHALRERDELVPHVDERHGRTASAQLHAVEDPPEERQRLVEVAYLDGDVVDPDQPGHGPRVTRRRARSDP